jgi:protein TonB
MAVLGSLSLRIGRQKQNHIPKISYSSPLIPRYLFSVFKRGGIAMRRILLLFILSFSTIIVDAVAQPFDEWRKEGLNPVARVKSMWAQFCCDLNATEGQVVKVLPILQEVCTKQEMIMQKYSKPTLEAMNEIRQMEMKLDMEIKATLTPDQQKKLAESEDRLPDVGEFVPVEKQPEPVEHPNAGFPDIARWAGIEGIVYVHILVDKTGKVKDVKVMREELLYEGRKGGSFYNTAIEAARKSVWKPATLDGKPVAVWVAYPIRFSLK